MRNTILLACAAATALFIAPAIGAAQTTAPVTNPESPVTTNPKSNSDTAQCTQPAPGETHMNTTNCPNVPVTTPKTMPKPKAKTKPATTTENKPTTTPPPVLPAASDACPKTGTTTPTPGDPRCDTKSGAHEGGPFGH